MSLVTESLEKRRDELAEQQAAKEHKPKIGPSGNKISMESVGSIKQAYTADRMEATNSITGRGYNLLTAPMWSAKHKPRGAIIDFTGLSNVIEVSGVKHTKFIVVTENSRSRLAEKFAEESSCSFSYGWFSASFSQNYDESSEVTEEKTFSKIWVEYIGMMEMITTKDEWKSHLNPVFWEDLNNKAVSPKALFDNYGTHVILQGYYGGNMDLLGTRVKSTTESTKTIGATVSAAVQAASATVGVSSSKSSSKSKEILNIKGDFTGGVGSIPGSLIDFADKANIWLESLGNRDNWSFCGVPKAKDALFAIWELAEEETRQKELEKYFNDELGKSKGLLKDYESYITDIKMVWGKSKSDAEALAHKWALQNYKFDTERNHDLNYHMGDGTGYIYIGYKRETREQMRKSGHKPITNLFILDTGVIPGMMHGMPGSKDNFEKWKKKTGGKVQLDNYNDVSYSVVGKRNSKDEVDSLDYGAYGKLQLCYTTDSRFTPLTALGVYNEAVRGEREAYYETREWIDIPSTGPYGSSLRRSTNFKKDEGVYLVFKRAEELFDPTPSEN